MRPIQAKVHSTTQRLGRTTKRCGSARLTISSFQVPVLATTAAIFGRRSCGVGEDALDEGEQATGSTQQQISAVAILHRGRMDHDVQEQAQRIDENVPLAARDLLARVVPLRIDRAPPLCAALALWLSMTAAEGLASRPSLSRTST